MRHEVDLKILAEKKKRKEEAKEVQKTEEKEVDLEDKGDKGEDKSSGAKDGKEAKGGKSHSVFRFGNLLSGDNTVFGRMCFASRIRQIRRRK